MRSEEVLERARKLLIIHRQISIDHLQHRNQTSVDFAEARESLSRHELAIAQHRLAMVESAVRIRSLFNPKPADSLERIAEGERQTLARLHARESVRTATERHLRAQARQAAVDRAVFISELQQTLPPETWDEALQEYDRRLYESREEDAP